MDVQDYYKLKWFEFEGVLHVYDDGIIYLPEEIVA